MTNYTLLSCIESKIIDSNQFYGRFALGNFTKGQGLTIANALRRSLLSQLVGTAICFAEIKEVAHEYESLLGVRECVLDMLLNLRQITLRSDVELFNTQVAYINVTGPGVVRARDLKLPPFIYVIDPNQYIATLSPKGKLNIKLLISCGKTYLTHSPSTFNYENQINKLKKRSWFGVGFQPPMKPFYSNYWNHQHLLKSSLAKYLTKKHRKFILNQRNPDIRLQQSQMVEDEVIDDFPSSSPRMTKNKKLGYFPIDAIFAPILKVNYTIEAVNKTKEKIYLEIWTNGALDPRKAIHKTVKALINSFLPLQTSECNPLPLGSFSPFSQKKNSVSLLQKKNFFLQKRFRLKKKKQRSLEITNLSIKRLGPFTKTLKKIKFFNRVSEIQTSKFVKNKNKKITKIKEIKKVKKFKPFKPPKNSRRLAWFRFCVKSNRTLFLRVIKSILKPKKKGVPMKSGFIEMEGTPQLIKPLSPMEQIFHMEDPDNSLPDTNDLLFMQANPIIKKGIYKNKIITQISKPAFNKNKRKKRQTKLQKRKIRYIEQKRVFFRKVFSIFKAKTLSVELNQLRLPFKIYFSLKSQGIHTVKQLIQASKYQLSQISTLKQDDLQQIQIALRNYVIGCLIKNI